MKTLTFMQYNTKASKPKLISMSHVSSYVILSMSICLSACGYVDDYMLGKDNTQKPAALSKLNSRINVKNEWSVKVGKSAKNILKPVVLGNIVYTANSKGSIEAVDTSGKVLWAKQLKSGIISGPTVKEGYIALGTDTAKVILLKQKDGSKVWQAKVSADALSSPVIAQNNVIVKTVDGNLYSFNLASGKQLWMTDHGAPNLILKASSTPVIMDKLALVGFADGKLDAVDLKMGNVVWQRSIAYPNGASDIEKLVDIDADPIVRGDTVYLATYQGYIGALSLKNGQFLWHKPASTFHNMAIDAKNLYITDSNDVVWAYNRVTGEVQWKQTGLKARTLTEPTLANGHLVVGDKTGFLHLLSTENGELIARTKLEASIDSAPAVVKNHLYVMTANGKLNHMSIG